VTFAWEPDPYDPDLDRPCTSCRARFHDACMGWWRWCPCACGLRSDTTHPNSNGQGDP
jgi:hypothetical protein